MEFTKSVPAIVGEAVAGESAKLRAEVEAVIKVHNSSMFDLAELLHKVRVKNAYEGFTTFNDYLRSLPFKYRRLVYLERMASVMEAVGLDRNVYEQAGLARLRSITRLEPNTSFKAPDGTEIQINDAIRDLVEEGQAISQETVDETVNVLLGQTGEEEMVFLHLYMKKNALDKVARPALELMKMKIGSVAKDEEGNYKDASDGAAAESIFADWLSGEPDVQ